MESINNRLVSIIVPVYNVEKYVGAAIESILNQTFSDFEFIIINDGSVDNTANIIKKYAEQDNEGIGDRRIFGDND